MTIQLTEKHYVLLIRILEIMAPFYGNNFASICKEVGETYDASEAEIQEACNILTAVNVTAPVPAMQETAERLLKIAKNPVILAKDQAPYTKRVDIAEDDVIRLVSILDAYSRILMGQFDKIYDALDVAPDDGEHEHRLQANHDARWSGVGVSEARDLLIPQLKKMGVGWNGSFGISNIDLAYNSKLSYEMLKALDHACGCSDSYCLKVTDEPFLRIPGTNKMRSL